jgi:hypothetical protein
VGFEGTILAIDSATATGICTGRPGETPKLETRRWRADETDSAEDIYGRAVVWMATRLRDDLPALVVIEQPVPPSAAWGQTNHDTTLITIGLFGIFCGLAKAKGVRAMRAPISSWRKYFLGRGNLKGDVAKRQAVRLCRELGWDAPDHNAAEAAGIWSWACAQVAPELAPRVEPLFVRAS